MKIIIKGLLLILFICISGIGGFILNSHHLSGLLLICFGIIFGCYFTTRKKENE